jgi:hypothetical protein
MFRLAVIAMALVSGGGIAAAQQKTPLTAAEMQTLLTKGLAVSSSDLGGGSEFTGRVNLAANGRLSGTITVAGHGAIALSGTWQLKGARLCRTIMPIEPQEVCETWVRSGPKEATVVVNGQPTSINRWQ